MRKYFVVIVFILLLLATAFFAYSFSKTSVSPEDQQAAVSANELKTAGLYDVTTYGADKNGGKDSTTAIQKAMDEAYANGAVAFFPSGTYLVSNTLKALQDRTQARDNSYALIGSTAGALPTIKLKAGSFNDNKNGNDRIFENGQKKAIIHFWTCNFEDKQITKNCVPSYDEQLAEVNTTNGNTAMQMGGSIRNLRFVIDSNNPDAIGIRFTGNQDNVMSNVVVDAGNGFAGIYGSIGTSSVSQNITINGGKYGIYGGYGGWGAYSNIRLKNQEILAFTTHQGPPVSMSGFEIIKSQAPAIGQVAGVNYGGGANTNQGGSISLSDGIINITNDSSNAVIDISSGIQFALVNVFINNGSKLIRTEDKTYNGSPSVWNKIHMFANTVPSTGVKLVNGVESTTDYLSNQGIVTVEIAAPRTEAIIAQHGFLEEKVLPSPDVLINLAKKPGSGVVNVRDKGIIPVNSKLTADSPDYSSALNALFQDPSVKYVFLPKGTYPIKNTITLGKNTTLIGISNLHSKIETHPSWIPGKRTDVLNTVSNAAATTTLAYLRITFDSSKNNNNFDAIHWMAGKRSIIYNVMKRGKGAATNCNVQNGNVWGNARADWKFDKTGGGRVWGIGTGGSGCSKFSAEYRGLLIDGTRQPLTIYGLNPEDGHGELSNPREGYMAEIRNARNVAIRSNKSENENALLIRNSRNILILNGGGSMGWSVRDNRNYAILNSVTKFTNWENSGTGQIQPKTMIEIEKAGKLTNRYNSSKTVSAITNGIVNLNQWNSPQIRRR